MRYPRLLHVSVQATLSGAIFHVEGRGHPLQEDVSVKINVASCTVAHCGDQFCMKGD